MALCHSQVTLMLRTYINITETTYSCQFQYEFVISKCVTAVKVSNFTCHYLGNRSTLDIGFLGFIGIVWHKEHPPEVWSVPPVTPCILITNLMHWLLFIHKIMSLAMNSKPTNIIPCLNSSAQKHLTSQTSKTPSQKPPPQSVLTQAVYRQPTTNSRRGKIRQKYLIFCSYNSYL